MKGIYFSAIIVLAAGCAVSVFKSCSTTGDPGWPQVNGPYGNFNPARYGYELVDDMAAVRKVWTSEDHDLGYAKTLHFDLWPRANWPGHPGSSSGVIAAGGKIFVSSFRPAGDTWAETELTPEISARWSPGQIETLRQNLRIDADDITLAIDAASGKTVWKAVEEHKGLCLGMRKFGGWAVTPAYYDGRVFSMGTTGRLYAYNARTGEKVWETDIGKRHRIWEAEKQQRLREKTLPVGRQMVSLIVADGVLIVPLFDSTPDTLLCINPPKSSLVAAVDGIQDISLRGVNPENGKTLWELPAITSQFATPAIWHYAGREYVLTATHGKLQTRKIRDRSGEEYVLTAQEGDPAQRTAKLCLISPRDGMVLWTVEGLANTHFALAPSDKTVLVNVGSGITGHGDLPWMLLAAYRLSPDGAERAWTMPDELAFWYEGTYEASDWRKYLIRDGKVYYSSASRNSNNSPVSKFFIFDEMTGQILYQKEIRDADDAPGPNQLYLIEDKIFHIPNASHGGKLTIQLWTMDIEDMHRLSAPWMPHHLPTTAYEVFLEFPYVDGHIFMRTLDGSVVCYDLRKPAKARSLTLQFNDPFMGRTGGHEPLNAVLWIVDGKPDRGFVLPGGGATFQSPDEAYRRYIDVNAVTITDTALTGDLKIDVGFHTETFKVQMTRSTDGFTGSYTRQIKPLPESFIVRGKIRGTAHFEPNSETTWTLELDDALNGNGRLVATWNELTLFLGCREDGSWQCSTKPSVMNMTNHELDATKLTTGKDGLHGEFLVVFHSDKPNHLTPMMHTPFAALYNIEAEVHGETVTGEFEGVVGLEWSRSGKVSAGMTGGQLME